jgi:hypothetical protein
VVVHEAAPGQIVEQAVGHGVTLRGATGRLVPSSTGHQTGAVPVSTPEPSAAPDESFDPADSTDSTGSTVSTDFSDLTGDESSSTHSHRGRIAQWAAIGTCVAIVALWAFVYVYAARAKPVDRLASQSFAQQAQRICVAAAGRLADLPPASASRTNVERADVVVQSNQILARMLDDLEQAAPRSGTDGRMLQAWLDDYRTYLGNRVNYADRLRTDPSARFYETEKQPGEQITIPIDTMATANDMHACTAPEDLS